MLGDPSLPQRGDGLPASTSPTLAWAVGAVAAVWATSCLLPGIEANGTSAGGAAGVGGAAGSGADASGGAGGQPAGGGGGSGGIESGRCTDVDDCEVQTCHAASCEEGTCVFQPTPDVLSPDQVIGDCKVVVCDDRGRYTQEPNGGDVPTQDPPPCRVWACDDGTLTTNTAGNCTSCCGMDDDLSCNNGVCVGCVAPSDCGSPSACFDYECSGLGECLVNPANEGDPCAPSTCGTVSLSTDAEHTFACNQGVCEETIATCGNYVCDTGANLCFGDCLDGPQVCQPGSDCDKYDDCVDCHTCAEVAGSSVKKGLCPTAKGILDDLKTCFCTGGGDDACSDPCLTLCEENDTVSLDCLTCLGGHPSCSDLANDCLDDVDRVP